MELKNMKGGKKHKKGWTVDYVGSYPGHEQAPKNEKPLVAIIGRSNVGKSSFINALCGQRELARTSAKPGKTQTLNYFLVNRDFYLVDMPGYGYAGVSKTLRASWADWSQKFILNAPNLVCLMILTDSNIPPQESDLEFINWCGDQQVPLFIIRTKTDKSKPQLINDLEKDFQNKLLETWEELPKMYRHSSNTKEGTETLRMAVETMCQ